MNCRQITADAFGMKSITKVNVGFYQDLAAVGAQLDVDSKDMTEQDAAAVREQWKQLLATMDRVYGKR